MLAQTSETKRFSLTPVQQGMFLVWREGVSPSCNLLHLRVDLDEALDRDALRSALDNLGNRHETLRTSFRMDGAEVVQSVEPSVSLPLETRTVLDIDAAVAKGMEVDRSKGLDIERLPLLFTRLFVAGGRNTLLITTHHILMDGASLVVLLDELMRLCTAPERALQQATPRQFAAHIERLRTESLPVRHAIEHFAGVFADSDVKTAPAFLKTQASTPGQRHLEWHYQLSPELTERLADFARESGASLHTLMLTAYGHTLGGFAGSSDVSFGSVRSGRTESEDASCIGMMLNTLPFRVCVPPSATLVEGLQSVRAQQRALRNYEHVPFSELRSVVSPKGERSLETFLMFDFGNLQTQLERRNPDWNRRSATLTQESEQPFSLSVYVGDHARPTDLVIEYDPSAAETRAVKRFGEVLVATLGAFLDPNTRYFSDLPTGGQGRALEPLEGGSRPALSPTVSQVMEQARRTPDARALVQGETEVSYAELAQQVSERTLQLQHLGVEPGERVGLSVRASFEMVVAILAVQHAGAAYVPLDPDFPEERLQHMLEDTEVRVVVADRDLKGVLPFSGETLRVDMANTVKGDAKATTCLAKLDAVAVVIFTSGSTGRPKGVELTHGNLVAHNLRVRELLCLCAQDRTPQLSTVNFDVSVEEVFCTLVAGAELHIPEYGVTSSVPAFLRMVDKQGLTVLNLTTLFFSELVHYMKRSSLRFPSSVRAIVAGGEKATLSALESFRAVGGESILWVNAYGPTENAPMSTAWLLRPEDELPSSDPPIGRPLPEVEARIVDSAGRDVAPGAPGELWLGGPQVARGYLKRPELTAKKFAGGYYRTGDRVVVQDGELHFRGRTDAQVKLRGFRIELPEIEAAARTHEHVSDAVAATPRGPSGTRQLAIYVKSTAASLDRRALHEYLAQRLPPFMTPQVVVCVESFPRSPSGKVDRAALVAPSAADYEALSDAEAATTQTEKEVTKVWNEVLGLELGVTDNFFHMGGDSLKALVATSQLEGVLNVRIPLALLLDAPTVRSFAVAIDNVTEDQDWNECLLLAEGSQDRPVFLVHSLGGDVLQYQALANALSTEHAVYGLQMRGLDRRQAPHESIEQAATDFLEHVYDRAKAGPYIFVGYSSGGLIAYEMARQLLSRTGQQAHAILLDTALPPRLAKLHQQRGMDLVRSAPKRLRRAFTGSSVESLRKAVLSRGKRLRDKLNRSDKGQVFATEEFSAVRAQVQADIGADLAFFPPYRIRLMESHYLAVDRYRPPLYSGPVRLVRPLRESLTGRDNADLGWSVYAPKATLVCTGQDHSTMLTDDGVFLEVRRSVAAASTV